MLYGVGGRGDHVKEMAEVLGSKAEQFPFSYLGISIADNMNRMAAWLPIIDKFKSKLSKWKASMLSIGGRLILTKWVLGSLGTYFMSMFPMLVQVRKALETLRAKFFLGSMDLIKKNPLAFLEYYPC